MNIWAFLAPNHENVFKVAKLYESIKNGRSRFGWSTDDEHNLKLDDNWSDWHSRQLFLLKIKKGDWIVHVNVAKDGHERGNCVAVCVTKEYDFDEGLNWDGDIDFRHFFEIDVNSIVEFDRNDKAVRPGVNLKPRRRYQRVDAVDEFLQSIDDIKSGKVIEGDKWLYYLRQGTDPLLPQVTQLIHKTHQSKKLERFLARVFSKIPGVTGVKENGSGYGTDHGADLILTLEHQVSKGLVINNIVVVQVKSHEGEEQNAQAVVDIENAIREYKADGGIIVTTAERTEELDAAITKASNELNVDIDLLAGKEVAQFVIEHAPELVFDLQS